MYEMVNLKTFRRWRKLPFFLRLLGDESGQDLIEYALIASMIGLGSVVSMSSLANAVSSSVTTVASGVSNALGLTPVAAPIGRPISRPIGTGAGQAQAQAQAQ